MVLEAAAGLVSSLRQPLWPALYGAFALTGNAVSGRVTFGVGVLFGLAAVAVICVWPDRLRTTRPEHRVPRAILAALLSALATAASPVAGLFVGVVAAALWLEGRRAAAYVLGISRAIGETMVVAIAAGMQPVFTWNPLEPAATMTAYIVQVSLGDLPHGSVGYQTIFATGLTLLLMTLVFNIVGHALKKRYRHTY